jgi:A/G-specific adenine glycosylase
LWRRAVDLLPQEGIERYTQGLMDLGATLCTRSRPDCARCPLALRCVALATDRVHLLPVRKPKKAVPQRQTSMLVVIDQGQVLLEQRPDSGIWGGLLSLPELEALAPADLDDEADSTTFGQLLTQALAPFGVPASCARLTPFSHVFTHFKLQISPYEVRLSRRLDRAGQDSHVWYPVERLADAPLPAPVKKLLLELFRTEDLFASARAA